MAYYAADVGDERLLRESVKQCGDYRGILQSKTTTGEAQGAWQHIIGPNSQDTGLWSSGNAWAAGGMTRVLATVLKAPVSKDKDWRQEAVDNLTQWIKEILDAAMTAPLDGGLLRNYLNDRDSNGHGFGEVSGSSLLSAVVYRMAVMRPKVIDAKYVKWADDIRIVLGGKDAQGQPHVQGNGVVTPAVNPLNWQDTKPFTSGSPEGQSFVVLMYAAWRDCVQAKICAGDVEKWQHGRFGRRAHN